MVGGAVRQAVAADGCLAFVNQDEGCGNQNEVKGEQGIGDNSQVYSVDDGDVEVDDREVTEHKEDSGW